MTAPVARDQVDPLRQRLIEIGNAIDESDALPYRRSTALHFVRWVVIDEQELPNGKTTAPCLVIDAVLDCSIEEHLRELLAWENNAVADLLAYCEEPPADQSTETIVAWMVSHKLGSRTFYSGSYGLEASAIRKDADVREHLSNRADALFNRGDLQDRSTGEVAAELRSYPPDDLPALSRLTASALFAQCLQLLWLVVGLAIPSVLLGWFLALIFGWSWSSLWHVLTLAGLITGSGLWFLMIRLHELRDADPDWNARSESHRHVRDVIKREDHLVMNQFTMIVPVKPGLFRRLSLLFVLILADYFSRFWWNRGQLVGVPTIHFARIFTLDRGRRMLFMSNFDGSWERYLADFLSVGAFAVVPIWTNLLGCPKTRWLLKPTPGFANQFLTFTRHHQVASHVWYAAYPDTTITNILNNHQLRRGLIKPPASETQSERWLQRL